MPDSRVEVCSRAALPEYEHWKSAFMWERMDHRFYELVEDTITQGFEYQYFIIRDTNGAVQAIQPFFVLDQDLLAGSSPTTQQLVNQLRLIWPRLLKMRTLMVGCSVGEGHLDGDGASHQSTAGQLASAIVGHARRLRAPLIVLKEFPARYRETLKCFLSHNFSRIPSLPMTRLNIQYASFDDYMLKALSRASRRKLRKKFRAAAASQPIYLDVVEDVTPIIDDVYPLYLQVYNRSKLHFERLTKAFLCGLGRSMPDKARFFLWRQNNRIVAFTLCMMQNDAIFAEYIGLDYSVALDLHLYHYAVRDMLSWGIAHGYKWFHSSGLNYDPKLHMRHQLDPVDLYVRHTSATCNAILKLVLPFIEPTRFDPVLRKFSNYRDLWGSPMSA
jgi:hypothetical protein